MTALGFLVVSYPRELAPELDRSLALLGVVVFAVALIDVKRLRGPVLPIPMLLFIALCAASTIWSVSPDDTARALLLYGGIAVFGFLVVANSETAVLLRGIVWGAVAIAALTLWAVAVGHDAAAGPLGDAPLRGYHGNRNVVSYCMVLGLAAALSCRPSFMVRGRADVWRLVRWSASLPVILLVLYLTRSGTGLVSAAVLVCAAALMGVARRTRLFATATSKITGAVVAGVLVALASSITPLVFEALGRRTDFSGRVPLWRAIVEVWEQAPLLGYGWGAIWPYSWFAPERISEAKMQIDLESKNALAHGHNIVFDLLPQLGIVGVLLLAVILGCAVGWLFVPLDDRDYVVARWAAIGVLALVVNGVSEPMLSIPVGWFVLVVIAAGTSRLRRDSAYRY